MLKVVVGDYSKTACFRLKKMLSKPNKIKVVAAAKNGKQVVEFCRYYQPQVVVLNLQMPLLDGLNAAKIIRQIAPNTKIIAYSSIGDPQAEVMVQTAPIDFYFADFKSKKLMQALNHINQEQKLQGQKLLLEQIYTMSLQEKSI